MFENCRTKYELCIEYIRLATLYYPEKNIDLITEKNIKILVADFHVIYYNNMNNDNHYLYCYFELLLMCFKQYVIYDNIQLTTFPLSKINIGCNLYQNKNIKILNDIYIANIIYDIERYNHLYSFEYLYLQFIDFQITIDFNIMTCKNMLEKYRSLIFQKLFFINNQLSYSLKRKLYIKYDNVCDILYFLIHHHHYE